MLGSSVLKFLDETAGRIDHYWAGRIIFEDIDSKVQEFLSSFKKKQVFEAQLHLKEIKDELKNNWNIERKNVETKKDPGAGSTSTTLTVEGGDRAQTPLRKVTFKKATPKSKLLEKLQCTICTKTYESLRTLRRHANKQHNGEGYNIGAKEVDNRVSCMICNAKQQRDLISRHVITMHGFQKHDKNSVLRGFISLDGSHWKPLWLPSHEPDPPKEVLVPVDEEGRVQLYGVKFEKDEIDDLEDENINKNNDGDKTEGNKDDQREKKRNDNMMVDGIDNTEDNKYDTNETVGELFENVKEKARPKVIEINTFGQIPISRDNPAVRDLTDEFCDEGSDDYDAFDVVKPVSQGTAVGHHKIAVENFTVNVEGGDFWSIDDIDVYDSDFDPTDSHDDNETRMHNKSIRRAKRNNLNISKDITKLETNKTVIEAFGSYLKQRDAKVSTVNKANGHLFYYHDSFLNYEVSKDPLFNLKRLMSPQDEDFIELSDPTEVGGWFDYTPGDVGKADAGRLREMLKAHTTFRSYLYEKIMSADFGNTSECYLKRDMVLRRLDMIKTRIENKKLFGSLQKQETRDKIERLKARNVLSPNNDFNEANCVVTWFESDEAKKEEAACLELHEKCMAGRSILDKDFSRFANWARFTIACEDRNRRAVYGFTNLEFMKRKPKWLPLKNKDDSVNVAEMFEKLPSNWNADSAPKEGAEPSCWVVAVSGADLKGNEDAQLVLTRRTEEICLKFREMKEECSVACEEKGPFFVNKRGKALAKLQRTKGSLLEKFGKVCGFEKATTNSLRRAAEQQIQNSPNMKQSVEKLQLHSSAVGLKYYDKSAQNVRASFVSQLSDIESPHKTPNDVPSEVKKRRLEMDVKEKETVVKEAEELLKNAKMKRRLARSKTNKVLPLEKEFMMKIYSVEINRRFNGSFPGVTILIMIS